MDDNLFRSMVAAEEEFANLKEKQEFVCDYFLNPVNHDWQMRIPDKWGGELQQHKDKPLYCFAISHSPWYQEDEVLNSYEESQNAFQRFIVKIFILVPEHCSLYHFANFTASSEGIACVGANSKIYVFGGGCGTSVWYMDVVGEGDNSKQGKKWKQAKACFNREKHKPLSFSLGNKIYALETFYLLKSKGRLIEPNLEVNGDDDYWFEVLDTSTDDSYWLTLCSPPYPFGACNVVGSWSTDGSGDQGDGYRIFVDTSGLAGPGGHYLFVYDVDTNTWNYFVRNPEPELVCCPPSMYLDYRPFYSWAVHSAGKDFAPFPPLRPHTGDLRVLTGLKRSIQQLHQLTSESQQLAYDYWKGLPLPLPVEVVTDRMSKVSVKCKNLPRYLTGWDLESLWSLHCLPLENMLFWQVIHLGGSSFCTIAYYIHSFCCVEHTHLYARVANFDITDAAAAGGGVAKYGPNKVFLVSKAIDVSPLPCSQLEPVSA